MKCTAAIAFLAAAASMALGQSLDAHILKVGDAAPAFRVASWIKGDPIKKLDDGKIYVIDFWATWCKPCRTSIPHLTDLQKLYKEQATFIGVSVFEQDWSKVAAFVKDEGDQMDYRVATDEIGKEDDGADGLMGTHWVDESKNGVPITFIVKGGKIIWIGHPNDLDTPLREAVSHA